MLIIKTLEERSFNEIEEVFNRSFSYYYHPARFTEWQLQQKFERGNGKVWLFHIYPAVWNGANTSSAIGAVM